MNKAFVREPEDTGKYYCPRCGSLGDAVGRAVLERYLQPAALANLGDLACYCPSPRCDVAYFDPFERTARVGELIRPAYPKDRDAPICACLGLTEDDLEADLAEGAPTRLRTIIAQSNAPDADCARRAANGRCCVAEAQRYYMQRLPRKGR